ncbi:MAG: CHAT domain-containing tetratricopeptide repeat protein [Bacteroidota bacterium]
MVQYAPLFLILFFCYPSSLSAQLPSPDTIQIRLQQIDEQLYKANFDSAIHLAHQAISRYLANTPDSLLANLHNQLAISHYFAGNYDEAIHHFDLTRQIRSQLTGPQSTGPARAMNNMAAILSEKGDVKTALQLYQQVHQIYQSHLSPNDPLLADLFGNMGIAYSAMGDYERSTQYFQKSLAIDLENFGENELEVAISYNNLANCYEDNGQYEKAIDYYKKALEIRIEKLGLKHPLVGSTYSNMGICFKQQGRFRKAIKYYEKELNIYKSKNDSENPEFARIFLNLGNCYSASGDIKSAIRYYRNSLEIILKNDDEISTSLVSIYQKIGTSFLDLGDYENALKYADKAIRSYSYDTLQHFQIYASKYATPVLWALEVRANANHELFIKYGDKGKLQESLADFQLIINSLEQIKSTYRDDVSKQILHNGYYSIFEKYIGVLTELKLEEVDISSEIFNTLERSKSLLLLEALKSTQAEQYAGIPNALIQQEQQLKVDLSFWEQKRYEAQSNEEDQPTISQLDSRIFDLKQDYEHLMETYRTDYPSYFQMKHKLDVITLAELQQDLLAEDEAMIEYFYGAEHLFVFVIRKDQISVHVEKDINRIDRLLNSYRRLMNAQEKNKERLAAISYELYQKIWEPIAEKLPGKIIIVPDGPLWYLPFEGLISEQPKTDQRLNRWPFILQQHQISYAYSATLLKEMKKQRTTGNLQNLLAVAPVFPQSEIVARGQRQALAPLKYNREEVLQLHEIWGGELLLDEAATESQFVEYAPNFQILHLATHAKSNDDQSEYSFLAFSELKDSIENEFLYIKDIYNLPLQADMVVLSACETGIGELKRGEGMISLSRAFSYAGARSILTTLWPISDAQSHTLMNLFYTELKEGLTKDEALRKAKIQYLEQSREWLAHPYYWAAFVPLGDMSAIELEQGEPLMKYALGLFIFILLMLGYQRLA